MGQRVDVRVLDLLFHLFKQLLLDHVNFEQALFKAKVAVDYHLSHFAHCPVFDAHHFSMLLIRVVRNDEFGRGLVLVAILLN